MSQAPSSIPSACNFKQALVDQRPKFDKTCVSRKTGIRRADKRRKKPKFL